MKRILIGIASVVLAASPMLALAATTGNNGVGSEKNNAALEGLPQKLQHVCDKLTQQKPSGHNLHLPPFCTRITPPPPVPIPTIDFSATPQSVIGGATTTLRGRQLMRQHARHQMVGAALNRSVETK
jgi:hypothetical protein